MGGQFYFDSKLTDVLVKNNAIEKIVINNDEKIDVEHVMLGIGHSARETFYMLHAKGVFMENKDFAIGARIEHPRVDIDKMQYAKHYNNPIRCLWIDSDKSNISNH